MSCTGRSPAFLSNLRVKLFHQSLCTLVAHTTFDVLSLHETNHHLGHTSFFLNPCRQLQLNLCHTLSKYRCKGMNNSSKCQGIFGVILA